MSKKREPLNQSGDIRDAIITLSEGNPGAINVLMEVTRKTSLADHVLSNLDSMNIRGSQIWVAFKDHCKQDVLRFTECVLRRDGDMVATVNSECAGYGEIAVVGMDVC